jgi:tRNA pseudouridine55 synthase
VARRPNPDIQGALLVDKPPGPTSHDVVAFVRRTLQTSRVGHTGTLDPLATGLLVVLVGAATRMAQFLAADEKEYVADVRLGIATASYDAASLPPDVRYPVAGIRYPSPAEVEAALAKFRGRFLQLPPAFSAKKVAGVAAYEKARRNEPVELRPVPVTVHTLERLDPPDTGGPASDTGPRPSANGHRPSDPGHRTAENEHRTADNEHRTSDIERRISDIGHRISDIEHRISDPDLVRLRVAASAGFYVRSLAHDLGQALGCGAHLEALRRTRVGRFRVEEALPLDRIEAAGVTALLPLNALLGHMPAVSLSAESARRVGHGNPVPAEKGDSPLFLPEKGAVPFFRLVGPDGTLLAVAQARPDGLLHPVVVLG